MALKATFCEPCKLVSFTSVKAEQFCIDCRERYCGKCALDHSKFRVLRNHQISSIGSETSCDGYLKPVNTRAMKEERFYDECVQDFNDRGDTQVKTHKVKGILYDEIVQTFHNRGAKSVKTRNMKECFVDNVDDDEDEDGYVREELLDRGDKRVKPRIMRDYLDENDQEEDGYVKEFHHGRKENTAGTEADEHVNPDYESGNLLSRDETRLEYDYVDVDKRIHIEGTRSSGKHGSTKMHMVQDRKKVTQTNGPTAIQWEARLDLKERREIERTTPSVTPRFDVKLLDTEIARQIQGIRDVLRLVLKLTLEKSWFTLSFGKKTIFKCEYQAVRRYGIKDDAISVEVGRKCELGPGFLKITTGRPKELYDMLRLF